jgi:predicted PurR-regulated permease PerM
MECKNNLDNLKRDVSHIKILFGSIVFFILIIILKQLKTIFIPLFVSLLLYFLFNGLVKRLTHYKIPKLASLTFLLILIFVIFYFLGVLIFSSITSFIDKVPDYFKSFPDLLKSITEKLTVFSAKLNITQDSLDKIMTDLNWQDIINRITAVASATFGSFATFLGNLILVFLFLMFMLASQSTFTDKINKAFSPKKAGQIVFVLDSIETKVQHYLLIKTAVSLLTALVAGIIIYIGGFDFVFFCALIVFVLNFIPNLGSIVATIIPVLIGLMKYGFSLRVLLVLIGLMLTQFILGNIVEPSITGKNLDLSPIVILFSLIFWGYTWGIIGMILAVPITSSLKIIFEHIPSLNPVAKMISDK